MKRERQGFRLFKACVTDVVPARATITADGNGKERQARWKDTGGGAHTARVIVAKKGKHAGADLIVTEAATWYMWFRDQLAVPHKWPAFASHAASAELGRNLVLLVAYHKSSGGQTDPALTDWLAGLSPAWRDKLVKVGLLSRERVAVAKAIGEHVADWRAALLAKGTTPTHADLVTGRARRIIDACGFTHYADVDADKVMTYLDGLRQDTEARRGLSAQTFNFYVAALKGFCRWMVRGRRATENPVAHLDGLNVRTDRRHDRRALTVAELHKLLDTTDAGPERGCMTGAERAMMYRLALETGLRANEIRTLTRGSFKLDGTEPTVTVAAAYSKHRREDTLPLRAELAAELCDFLAGLAPAAQAFRLPADGHKAASMFNADTEAAGVVHVDDAGRYADFHALRHTFITNLANGGVHPKIAQALARHSTITLTMDRYSHVVRGDQAAALAALPDLSGPARQQGRATGTDNARATAPGADPHLASCLLLSGRRGVNNLDSGGLRAGRQCATGTPGSVEQNANSPRKTALGSVRLPGGARGLQNR